MMSGFENGTIILDEERGIYYAGQVLCGRIEFGLSQPLMFKAITVEFHGESSVQWDEVEVEEYNNVQTENTIEYSAQEEYFNVVHCVCGGVGVSQLPAGSHSIPFRYQIPPTVPSYFEGHDGGVTYYVKAYLDYADERPRGELECGFEVVVPLDLNVNPEMKQPIFMDFEEVLGSCLCGSGPMTLQVRLPATGYCPGQAIPVEVDADNQSTAEISKIIFELVRRESYHSQNPQSDQIPPETSLEIVKKGPIMAKTKRSFTWDFLVPDMIAPVMDNCGIIDIGFFFKVKLKMAGCNDDLEDEAEICLGLVPLHDLTRGQYTHPLQSDLPKGPIPNLNAPPEFIQPYVYPSITIEKIQPVHVPSASNYPGSTAPLPGNNYPPPGNAPYPGNTGYPGSFPTNAPYPGANSSYPGTNSPYPGATPYPGANSQYPGSNPPYPGATPPYPDANSQYPGKTPPYPSANSPYPGTSPSNPPAPAPSTIGFIAPGLTSPGHPTDPVGGPSFPYNPSAPSAP